MCVKHQKSFFKCKINIRKSLHAAVWDPASKECSDVCDVFSSSHYVLSGNKRQQKPISVLCVVCLRQVFVCWKWKMCLAFSVSPNERNNHPLEESFRDMRNVKGRKRGFWWFLVTIEPLLSPKKSYLYKTMKANYYSYILHSFSVHHIHTLHLPPHFRPFLIVLLL